MQKLQESLHDPSWWISVVIVGIALNLVSAYLRDALDWCGRFVGRGTKTIVLKDIGRVLEQSKIAEADPVVLTIIASSVANIRIDSMIFQCAGTLLAIVGVAFFGVSFAAKAALGIGITLSLWASSKSALARKRELMLTYILQRRLSQLKAEQNAE